MSSFLFCSLFFFFVLLSSIHSQVLQKDDNRYIRDKLYRSVYGKPCVLLLDNNQEIGCKTGKEGVKGPLFPLLSESELAEFLNSTSSQSQNLLFDNFVLVLNSTLFNKVNYNKLVATKRVTGVVVLSGPPPPDSQGYSNDETFPQSLWGLRRQLQHTWNPPGDSWIYARLPIPIYGLDQSQSSFFLEKATENKEKKVEYPRHVAELNSYMWAKDNSSACLAAKSCLPVGGLSVWGVVGGGEEKWIVKERKKVIVQSGIDSMSFFHDLVPGADADISSLIAILSAQDALHRSNSSLSYQKDLDLVYAFWSSESFGYSGSKRFVKDLLNFTCQTYSKDKSFCSYPRRFSLAFQNLSLDSFSQIIELNQVGFMSEGGQARVYLHQEKKTNKENQRLIEQIQKQPISKGKNISVSLPSSFEFGIPPSSLMSFLLEKDSIPSLVLTDHDLFYSNKYYHSQYDERSKVNLNQICLTSSLLAQSIYSFMTNGSLAPDTLLADCKLVAELQNCLMEDFSCPLISQFVPQLAGKNIKPNYYTSVYAWRSVPFLSKFIHDFLVSRGVANVNYHDALSPGFDTRPDGSYFIADPKMPVYTESTWDNSLGMRVYLEDNSAKDLLLFFIGLLLLLISLAGVYLAQRFSERLFER